jgi:hypothetical protein
MINITNYGQIGALAVAVYAAGVGTGYYVSGNKPQEPDRPPYSLAALRENAELIATEKGRCENGAFDGKPWKPDYCGETIGKAQSYNELHQAYRKLGGTEDQWKATQGIGGAGSAR